MNELRSVEESYTSEVIRKGIHLVSLSIPVIYFFIPKSVALTILIPLTLLFLLSDLARMTIPAARGIYHRFFGFLLRSHELSTSRFHLTGATYVLISATVGVWVFPKVVFVSAFAILIVSDSVAALIGRRFGRHPFFRKSLEGAGAFFVSAVVVILISPKVQFLPAEYAIGFAGAGVGTLVESWTTKEIDDNLSIPLSIGLVMWALYLILLPGVDVFALDKLI
jgi:dolichol kinase